MENKATQKNNLKIGIFDSGLGGLTVLRYLLDYFPNNEFVYLGDLGNLPYGNKSKNNIIDCSIKCAQFLETKKVDSIVIACNTASSYSYEILKKNIKTPIFDVITPCIQKINTLKIKKIGILGTEKTIESNIYAESILETAKDIKIYNKACPLFVPIVEEGLEHTQIAQMTIDYYLKDIQGKIDTLVLGCTHYPILCKDLNKYFNNKIQIIHSGPIIGEALFKIFSKTKNIKNLKNTHPKPAKISYYVTDLPERFKKLGNKFLNQKITSVKLITL
tara:strand:+ start:2282 stop:3106 length:825 start_codon:yes stop_codon:yes gene_type:complete